MAVAQTHALQRMEHRGLAHEKSLPNLDCGLACLRSSPYLLGFELSHDSVLALGLLTRLEYALALH